MVKKSSLLSTSLLLAAFLLNAVLVVAHGGSEGVKVRVTGYSPITHEYNFSCTVPNKTDASNIGSLKFYDIDPTPSFYPPRHNFLSPDGNVTWHLDPDNFYEEIHSNAMYHIYCEVQNFTAPKERQNLASEFHIDLRKTHNQKDPNIYVLDSEGPRATLKCDPPPGTKRYTLSWALRSREGIVTYPQLDNKNIVNITAPKATAGWDVVCDIFDKDKGKNFHWDMPVEFFEAGPAYIPTIEGCIQNEPCSWAPNFNGIPINGSLIVNVTLNSTPVHADIFLNEVQKGTTDAGGILEIRDIAPGIYNLVIRKNGYSEISTLVPIAAGRTAERGYSISEDVPETMTESCHSTSFSIPPSCAGGTITTDDISSSCRLLICSNGTSSMKVLACNKPSNSNPEYFEMYKQSQDWSNVKQICLGNTCIKDSGFARSPNFPICTGNATLQIPNGSLRVSTIPNFADVFLNNVLHGNSGLIGSLTIDNLVSGPYQLLVKKADYNDNLTRVNVISGQLKDVQIKLSRASNNSNTSNPENSTGPTNSTQPACFRMLQSIPSSCEGQIAGDSMVGGCRVIGCNSGSNSMQIKACDKPDGTTPQFFEMYRQTFTGMPLKICIGSSCMKNEGFVKSQDYPMCFGNRTSMQNSTNTTLPPSNTTQPPSNTTRPTTNTTCHNSVNEIPPSCTSTITQDTKSGCRTLICGDSANSVKVLACDKPDSGIKQFFEMYRQSFIGTIPKLCLADTCIQLNGYAKSANYPICT